MGKTDNTIMRRRLMNAYLSSVISISLVLLLVGIASMLLVNAKGVSDYFKENMQVSVLMKQTVAEEDALKTAKRTLSGNRLSDGFNLLQAKGQLNLSLEALVVDKRFTQLFTDEEANEALMRLLEVGYRF